MPPNGRIHINLAFGLALREYRTQRGIAQEALAAAAGLDRTYISTLELGRSTPKLDTMLAISEALNVELSVLVARIEQLLKSNA